jgi:hypothetical protein
VINPTEHPAQQQQHVQEHTDSAVVGGDMYPTPRSTELFSAELQGQLSSRQEQQEALQHQAQVITAAIAAAP